MGEQDVNVSLEDNLLTISGEKREEERREKENYHVLERRYRRSGPFPRRDQRRASRRLRAPRILMRARVNTVSGRTNADMMRLYSGSASCWEASSTT